MTDRLLPCPFCGGNADYLKVYAPKHEDGHDNRWRVRCEQGCGAMVPSFIGQNRAAEAWNSRATPPQTNVTLLRTAIQDAVDLLLERAHGNSARSPAHNARLTLQAALAATEAM